MTETIVDLKPDRATEPVLWAMATARAVRKFDARPVSDQLIETLVFAATRASSPRNQQPWSFVAMRDAASRQTFADLIAHRAAGIHALADAEPPGNEQRMLRSSALMIDTIADAPVLMFVCRTGLAFEPQAGVSRMIDSAVYGATANMLVAARSMGLGGAFTTLHIHAEREVRELLQLPDELDIAVTVPLGYPASEPGPVRRQPISDVLHWDAYGGTR